VIVVALSVAPLFAPVTPWRGALQVSGHRMDAVIKNPHANSFRR
jgi:hypothetical protein